MSNLGEHTRSDMMLHYIMVSVIVGVILVVFAGYIVKSMSSECFTNRSPDGYYWETDTASFVSHADKQLAVDILYDKLKKRGIDNVATSQLLPLRDSTILDMLDMMTGGELSTDQIAMIRMYVNPEFYLATTYVNEARASGKFSTDTIRKLVYDTIAQYYMMSKATNELLPLEALTDADIIKEFDTVQAHKSISDGMPIAPDLGRMSELGLAYSSGKRIHEVPKIVSMPATTNTELVAPTVQPAITLMATKPLPAESA